MKNEDEDNEFYKLPLKLALGPSNSVDLSVYEVQALVQYWAEQLLGADLEFFYWHVMDELFQRKYSRLLHQMERFLGRERIHAVVDEVYATWKAENPTLWKIWHTGTDAEWTLVRDIVVENADPWDIGFEFDLEASVKAALAERQPTD